MLNNPVPIPATPLQHLQAFIYIYINKHWSVCQNSFPLRSESSRRSENKCSRPALQSLILSNLSAVPARCLCLLCLHFESCTAWISLAQTNEYVLCSGYELIAARLCMLETYQRPPGCDRGNRIQAAELLLQYQGIKAMTGHISCAQVCSDAS